MFLFLSFLPLAAHTYSYVFMLFILDCTVDKPGSKCALITTFINLTPESIDPPITVGDKEVVREKVVDGMRDATIEGGVIYNALACPLNPTSSPTVTPSLVPSVAQGQCFFVKL